jgi:hypothetical protein
MSVATSQKRAALVLLVSQAKTFDRHAAHGKTIVCNCCNQEVKAINAKKHALKQGLDKATIDSTTPAEMACEAVA